MLENPSYILECGNMSYGETPKQDVAEDSALYSIAILMHLSRGIRVKDTIFSQSNITYLRKSLFIIFHAPTSEIGVDPRKFISRDFLTSFFRKHSIKTITQLRNRICF